MADRTSIRPVVLGILLVSAAVACGGEDDGGGDDGGGTASTAATTESASPASTATTTEPAAPPSTRLADVEVSDEAEPPTHDPVSYADHLEAGMCFDDTVDDQGDFDYSGEPLVVDCESPHDNEVVLVNPLDGGADAPYPDDEVWDGYFDQVCDPAIRDFLAIDEEPSTLNAYFLGPDEDEWTAGSRSVACVIYLPDAKLAGSVEGAGDAIVPAGFPVDAPRPDGIELSSTGTIEESYSPSESFAEEAGIDPEGFRVATFEGGEAGEFKQALEAAFATGGWDVTLEDHWSGGVATAEYALAKDGTRMIVEIWELEGGDSRLHYFYAPS